MKLIHTQAHEREFEVVAMTADAQAAMMTLHGDAASDERPSNEHPRCEQWLYVISGTGSATVILKHGKRRSVKLRAGSLLVIEHGELHQIKNAGWRPLRTINFYIPPAYKADGTLRPTRKR